MAKKGKRRAWSAKDTRTLKSLAQKKTPARQIARELGRTEGAVRQKALVVGTSLSTSKARRKYFSSGRPTSGRLKDGLGSPGGTRDRPAGE
jgi:hypothetical protein